MEYHILVPGEPGFAVTLFVIVFVVGSLMAFRFKVKRDYTRARTLKRRTKVSAFAAAIFYLGGWVFLALKNAFGF